VESVEHLSSHRPRIGEARGGSRIGEAGEYGRTTGIGLQLREDFPERDSQGVEIGAPVEGPPAPDLGGHVRRRASDFVVRPRVEVGRGAVGEAEVQDPDAGRAHHEDVAGLDVQVNHACGVHLRQGQADGAEQTGDVLRVQRARGLGQRAPFEPFQHEEDPAVLGAGGIKDSRADPGGEDEQGGQLAEHLRAGTGLQHDGAPGEPVHRRTHEPVPGLAEDLRHAVAGIELRHHGRGSSLGRAC
jgi:hypothetical protein